MKRSSRCSPFFALVLSVSLCANVYAQTGQIDGVVTDASALPVVGLTVQLEDEWGGFLASTTTAAGTGAYAFTSLADGVYVVHAVSDAGLDLVGEYYDDVSEHDQDLATRLSISGNTLSDIDFELGAAGSISGTLSGLAPGESVSIYVNDYVNGRGRGGVNSDPSTFAYTLPWLAAGNYRLTVSTDGTDRALQWYDGRDRHSLADTITLAADQDLTGIDLALTQGAGISGTVALVPDPADGGLTLQRMGVNFYDAATGEHVASTGVQAGGTYSYPNLPPGTYVVQAETHDTGYAREYWVSSGGPVYRWQEGEPVSTVAGATTSGIDFVLELGREISGHVQLEPGGQNVEGASVQAHPETTSYWSGAGTDAAGDYTMTGLPPGRYWVTVESSSVDEPFVAEQWDDLPWGQWSSSPVDVTTVDQTSVDFGVAQDKVIRGQVFLDSNDNQILDPGEAPFANVTVRAFDYSDGRHVGHAAVGSDGIYSIGVAAGTYRVEADPHFQTLLRESWLDAFFAEDAAPVDVQSGDANDIDFGLVAGSIYGTLRGRVVAAVGGAAIPGIQVQVQRFATGEWTNSGSQTDANGDWVIYNLPPGAYQVWFDTWQSNAALDRDYVPSHWSSSGTPGDTDPANLRIDYPAVAGDGTDLSAFGLTEGGSISGTVYPPAGDSLPLPTDVQLEWPQGGPPHQPGTQVRADGSYHIRGIPTPASLRVLASPWDGDFIHMYYQSAGASTFDSGTAVEVAVSQGVETAGIDLHLVRGGSISGTITQWDGTPLVNFPIWADLRNDPQGRSFWPGHHYTDANGAYRFRGLPSGDYWVQTDDYSTDLVNEAYPSLVTVVAPGEESGIDFVLDLGGSISGTVRDEATTLSLAGVCIYARDWTTNRDVGSQCTGASGLYRIAGLPGGSYRLHADAWPQDYLDEHFDDARDFNLATPVDVPATPVGGPVPEVTNIDFDLTPGLSISGTVTEAATGNPIPNLQISAHGPWGQNATTGSDGTYEIIHLGPDQYNVVAETSGTPYARQEQPVDLSAGSISGVDFALGPGASILGNVVDDDSGLPLADVQVSAHRVSPAGGWAGDAWTDALGDYEISGLAAGSFQVQTEPDARNFVRAYYNNLLSGWDPVVVGESGGVPQDVTGIDFSLVQGNEIRGLVFHDLDDDGVLDAGEPPVNNAWVNSNSENEGIHNWTGTGGDGTYVLHGTYPGRHTVQAGPHQGNLIPEYFQNVYSRDAASLVDVTTGDAAGIDFSLIDGATVGTLRGQVTGSGGIPGVDVQAWLFDTDEHVASTTSDANGNFVFTNLAPGSYKIWFETSQTNVSNDTDYLSSFWASTGQPGVIDPNLLRVDYPAVLGDGTDLGAFSLLEGGSISGQVVPQGGAALPPGLQVQAENFETGGDAVGANVDASGNYHLRGLPAPVTYRVYTPQWSTGDLVVVYYLTASESTFDHGSATAVQVESGLETSSIDLFPWQGGSISGRVTRLSDGTPVVGVGVNSDLIDDPLGRGYWYGGGQTDSNGDYVIRGLPSGDYDVRAQPGDPGLASQTYPSPVAVTAPGDTGGIDFALDVAGTIRGRVTQLVGGVSEPVANMGVQADDYDTGEYGNESNTDVDGYYTIGSLNRGQAYRVYVKTHQGHDPQFFNFISEYWNGHWAQDQADPVVVPTGEPAEAVADFELELGGAISGLVTGGGGPLQNVGMCAWDFGSSSYGNCDSTDHNGFYIIRGLPATSYRVDANPWPQDYVQEYFDNTTDGNNATSVAVQPVPEGGPVPITPGIDFDLDPAFRISGTVTDAGAPLANIDVSAQGIDVNTGAGDTTRADGSYELRGLEAGQIRVVASGGEYVQQEQEVDLTAGSVTGVDFALQVGAAISGRVFLDGNGNGAWDAGEEQADVRVDVYDFDTGDGFGSAQTGADGSYRLPGLGAGSYRVEIQTDERNFVLMYWSQTLRWDEASPVVVFEVAGELQDVGGIDFSVVQGGEIRGTVFYDANGDGIRQGPDEPTVGSLWVNARSTEEEGGIGDAWGYVEPDGTYALHGLYLGEQYRVRVRAEDTPYASEYYKLEGGATVGTHLWSEADAVDISTGEATGIDFSLDLGGGIRGVVRDRLSGQPLPNVDVYANLFDEGGMWNGATTDNNGEYNMTGLPAGEYSVETWDNQRVYLQQYYNDALFWEDASPFQVDARVSVDDTTANELDFYLDEGGALEGRVYDSVTDVGIPDVGIYAEEHGGDHRYLGEVWTEADGTFRLGALPPATDLRIYAQPDSGDYFMVFYDGGDDPGSPYEEDALALVLNAGETITDFDFALEQAGVIEGQVTDQGTGAPLGGVDVQVEQFDEPHSFWNSVQTEADGTYHLGGLVPDLDVRVSADRYPDYVQRFWTSTGGSLDWGEADPVRADAGETVPDIDFALDRAGAISGSVTDGDGAPLADQQVCANSYDGGPGGSCDNTDATGLYTLRGLPAGDYRVDTGGDYPYEAYDNQTDWNAADRVSVTSGVTTTGIDFVMPRVPELVSGPTPAAGERGSTVTGIAVTANSLHGGLCGDPVTPPCITLAFGGTGLTVESASLDEPSGTITFDLAIAADAALGLVSLSVVNHQALEDGAAFAANAFEVQPAATGDVPAASSERLYVPDGIASSVRVYGVADHSLLGTIETVDPAALVASPDGSHLFVSSGDRKLAVIDTRLGDVGEEVARIPLYGAFDANSLALTTDTLYATDREAGESRISVIDPLTWERLETETIELSASPFGIHLNPAQPQLWARLRNARSLEIVDVAPASPTYRQVLQTVPLPDNARPDDLAFTPDGSVAYVATNRGLYAVDTNQVLTDPAGATSLVWSGFIGVIEILDHTASGKVLAFIRTYEGVGVLDLSAGPGSLRMLSTIPAGSSAWFSGLRATADKLFIANGDVYELYAADIDSVIDGSALSVVRFDARAAQRGLLHAGAPLTAPTPAAPPAAAPVVSLSGGSPATNNSIITVDLSGANFAADAVVRLQGVLGQGNVTSASPTGLTVEFPATTPTGDHTVVVTNPNAGTAETGLSDLPLEVRPPAAFDPSQTLYATGYAKPWVSVVNPNGTIDRVNSKPLPGHMAVSPDGRLGFIGHYDLSEWFSDDWKPVSFYDVTMVDLDPASPTYLDTLGTAPWVFQSFTPMVVTPDPESPNGVFAYAANRYMSDTVSVIDPATLSELDIDGDPATESIPWQHPYWWWVDWTELPHPLAGISRIELDADVLDSSLQPTDLGLTPDGSRLYVANRAGSVSIVDTVTRQVVGQLDHDGNLSFAGYLEVAPVEIQNSVYVYVVGNDTAGQVTLFIFEAGHLDDASARVDRIPLPIQDEFPREMTMSQDGKRVYLTIRQQGVLLAMDVWPANRGQYDTVCITEQSGAVVRRNANCADTSEPIPGLLHAVEAAADGLLYVNNSFGEQIWALDSGNYDLVTSLGVEGVWLAVQPAAAVVKPAVATVSPNSGSPDGGDPVLITGANFQPGANVLFGVIPATGVVVQNSYSISALTPASSPPGTTGPVEVKVENPDGRTGKRQDGFTYAVDATPPVFTTPPYVAGQALVGDPGSETVTAEIRWVTDEASTSVVDYRRVSDPTFAQQTDPALVTDHVVTLTGLDQATDYEYRATSADAQGNTADSPAAPATLTFSALSAPDVTPPVILSGPTTSATTDSATVVWQTNEVSTSVVIWDDVVDGAGLDETATGAQGTNHSVGLVGLTAGTDHEYKAWSTDLSGNGPTLSPLATFTTDTLPDATPPVITAGPELQYLANDLVIVYWETDELSNSFVNYGIESIAENGVVDMDLVTAHVVFLTNLLPNTTYYYQAGSIDPSGNTVLSIDPFESLGPLTAGTSTLSANLRLGAVTLMGGTTLAAQQPLGGFTTPEAPDTTPPVVLSTNVTALSHDRALVEVQVDEAASLLARYGIGGLDLSAFDPTFGLTPSLLLAGLEPGTSYELALELTDPKGNVTTVTGLAFATPLAPDETAPVISGLTVDSVSDGAVRILWQTDELASASVRFGLAGGPLSQQVGVLGLRTSHAVWLGGLESSTAYDFEAWSRDTSANEGLATGSFTTLASPPQISSVLPAQAAQGASLQVVVNGSNFGADAAADFGPDVMVDGLTVNGIGSQLQATISVEATAPVGARQVLVTTNGYTATAAFAVVDQSVPVVTITTPTEGQEIDSTTVWVEGTVSESATVTVNGIATGVTAPAVAGDPFTFQATVELPAAGSQRVVAEAIDTSGNRGTAVVNVTVVNQPPVALCRDVVVQLGPDCTAEASIDDGSNDPDGDPLTITQEPAGPFAPGQHTVELTVEDDKGASATCSATVTAALDFDGFLPPIGGADDTGGGYGNPLRTFKLQSTIPVKFRVSCSGTPYLDGSHTLQTVMWSNEETAGHPIDASPQDAATAGNAFRLTGEDWHFNLDAYGTGMSEGQWQLVARLADGTQHVVWIQLK